MAANTFITDNKGQVMDEIPDLQDQSSLMLCRCRFSGGGRESISHLLDFRGGQYIEK